MDRPVAISGSMWDFKLMAAYLGWIAEKLLLVLVLLLWLGFTVMLAKAAIEAKSVAILLVTFGWVVLSIMGWWHSR